MRLEKSIGILYGICGIIIIKIMENTAGYIISILSICGAIYYLIKDADIKTMLPQQELEEILLAELHWLQHINLLTIGYIKCGDPMTRYTEGKPLNVRYGFSIESKKTTSYYYAIQDPYNGQVIHLGELKDSLYKLEKGHFYNFHIMPSPERMLERQVEKYGGKIIWGVDND